MRALDREIGKKTGSVGGNVCFESEYDTQGIFYGGCAFAGWKA